MTEQRKCQYCSKLLKRRPKESIRDFNRRKFCNRSHGTMFQHSGKAETFAAVSDAEKTLSGSSSNKDKLSAKEFLEGVVNDKNENTTTRVSAARALLPYQEKKPAERGVGKKEEKAAAAKEASVGRFAPMKAPRLVKG